MSAGDYDWGGDSHSWIPVVLRFSALPTFLLRSRGASLEGSIKLELGPVS